MFMTHVPVPEIVAENLYHKTGTINQHENRACLLVIPETDIRKLRYQTAWQTRQKPVPVFGTDFW